MSQSDAAGDGIRALARELWPLLRCERATLARSYALGLCGVALGLLAPWPLKLLIDGVLPGVTPPAFLPDALVPPTPLAGVAALSAVYLLVAIARALASYRERVIDSRVRERLTLAVRDRLLAHLQTLPPEFLSRRRSGEIVHRLVTDSQIFVRSITRTAPLVFQHTATASATLVAMFVLEPRLGLVGAIMLPVLVALARIHGGRLAAAARDKRACEGNLAGFAQEIVRGMPALQAAGEIGEVRARFEEVGATAVRASVGEARLGLAMERTLQVAQALTLAATTGIGASLVLEGRLSVGDLTVFVAYVTALLKPVEKVNELAGAVSQGFAAGARLLEVLHEPPAVRERGDARALSEVRGRIELSDVHFRHPGMDREVLRGASAVFEPGHLSVITGRNGAGKSTLLHLLARLFDPDAGRILLDGHAFEDLTLDSVRAHVSVLTQRAHLFAGTLRRALARGHEALADERLWDALEAVDLARFVAGLPGGLDARLGEDGVNLSGGQRQRLALARAIVLGRPVLLLDEPTASVDAESERAIVQAIVGLLPACTCIAVSHRSALIERADAVWWLEDGVLLPSASGGTRVSAA